MSFFRRICTQPGAVDKAVEGSEVVYLVVGFDYKLKVWEDKWPKLMRATIDACIKHKARLVFFDNVYMYDIKCYSSHDGRFSHKSSKQKRGSQEDRLLKCLLDEVKTGKLMALIARSADFYGPAVIRAL